MSRVETAPLVAGGDLPGHAPVQSSARPSAVVVKRTDYVQLLLLAGPAVGLLVLAARFGGPIAGLDSLLAPVLVLAGVGFGVVVFRSRAGHLAGGRYVQVRGHVHGRGSGLRRLIAKHEAGHAVAARALGGQVLSATVSPSGDAGLVQARFHENDPVKVIAFLKAGQYAVGTSSGAGADDAAVRAELRTVPREDRSRVRREAERTARRIVSSRSGEIRRDAARLNEKGAL